MKGWIDADWPAPAGIRALTTLRHGPGVSRPPFDRLNLGIRNGDDIEAVTRNRAVLVDALALPSAPRWLRQVHGAAVARFDADAAVEIVGAPGAAIDPDERDVDGDVGRDEPEADAAVTDARGVVLAILTADCLPVVFAARDGSGIGVAHAGWRGLAGGVLEATLAAMAVPADRLIAWLGPAAGPEAYEIGEEVREAFVGPDPGGASAFIPTRPGHWRVDLYALARRRLVAAGMAPTAIHGGGHCTIGEAGRFFSHRRDGRSGRMATLAWID